MNQLYRLVTEVTNDCLWEWDLVTKEIFWIDGGHKRVFGYDVENALISQSFWESCLHPEDKERVLAGPKVLTSSYTNNLWQDEYRFRKADGSYAHVRDRSHIVYNEQRQAIQMVGATQDVTEMAMLEQKITRERRKQQAEVTDAVFTALEDEKATIGTELHLIQTQELTLARIYLEMGRNHAKNKELYLEKSYGFLTTAIQELNKVSKDLGIPNNSGSFLFKGVQSLLDDLMLVHAIEFKFQIHEIEEDDLSEKTKLTVFRIIQEQLKNVLTHSHAKEAIIILAKDGDQLQLYISDNGQGCNPDKVCRGVGILNMKSRIASYNGTLAIRSSVGKGYELNITLPITSPVSSPTDKPEPSRI
jgi:PAS domain S-box-containing protein